MVHAGHLKVRFPGAALVSITAADVGRTKAALSPFNIHKDGRTSLSGSGFVWAQSSDDVVVLTSAAAFQPYVNRKFNSALSAAELTSAASIRVQVGGQTLQGRCSAIVTVPAAARAAQQLLSARTVGGSGSFRWRLTPSEAQPADVSLVMVITCRLSKQPLCSSIAQPAGDAAPSPGAAVVAVGCPFGVTAPQHFAGLQYNGVISQVVQDAGGAGLLLADFTALPGMEGGPVFDSSGALVGMVATPLCISGYELPVIIPAASLDTAVSGSVQLKVPSISRQPAFGPADTAVCRSTPCGPAHRQQTQLSRTESEAQLECHSCSAAAGGMTLSGAALSSSAQTAAVLLQATRGVVGCSLSSGQWASGILVNRRGTVLTNAHLFDASAASRSVHITITLHSDAGLQTHAAAILRIFSGALDIAVLQMLQPPPDLQPLALGCETPECGAGCCVAGHALFNPSSCFAPLLTHGNLAQVLRLPCGGQQRAAMLLTTAAVHSGASGGAVLDTEGRLLGMVTSNARHVSGQTIPHLNFSIASEWLQPLWQHLQQQTQEVGGLARFDTAEDELVRLWTLQPFEKQPGAIISRL